MRPMRTLPLVALAALLVVTSGGCRRRTVRVEPNEIPRPESTTPTPPPAGTTPMPGEVPPPTSPTTPPPAGTTPPGDAPASAPTAAAPSAAAQARVRVIHALPDGPPVDIYAGRDKLISGLAFKGPAAYVNVPARLSSARVTRAGEQATLLGPVDATLVAGKDYTAVMLGTVASRRVTPLLLADDNTPPDAAKAKIRVVHAAPDAPPVDVLVDDRPAISNLAFGKATDAYTQLDARTYQVKIAPTGATTAVLGPLPLALEAGKVYTVLAVGRVGDKTLSLQMYTDR